MSDLDSYIREHEQWLMERILAYAKAQGYTEYTSTLVEPWRVSVQGLSQSIINALKEFKDDLPQFHPDDCFAENSIAQFGVNEARLHRARGISLQMFLGLYKYYRYAYTDLIREMDASPEQILHSIKFVERIFDLIEIAFCSEWSGLSSDNALLELQKANRFQTNDKNKYLTLFESMEFPCYLVDIMGRIDNMNIPAIKLLGISAETGTLYYGEESNRLAKHHEAKLTTLLPWLAPELNDFLSDQGAAAHHYETVTTINEQHHFFEVNFARMKDISGKFEGGVITIHDVTDRKSMERQLAQSQKLESIGQLASGIAHEINTPIQYIGHNLQFLNDAFTELLQTAENLKPSASEKTKEPLSDKTFEELMHEIEYLKSEVPTAIRESTEGISRVSSIVQALKQFAHPDHQSKMRIHLGELVDNIVQITINEWIDVARIKTIFDDNLSLIDGIRGEINQIVLNVLMNAIQAIQKNGPSSTKGEISISTLNQKGLVEIRIEDNGCGIAETNKHRIFDPFFTTRNVGSGPGQGLGVAYSLVKKHKGSIDFKSKEGVGTTFIIRFPTLGQ